MSSPEAPAASVSKVECLATVPGRGVAKVSLFKHLAPLTVNALLRVFPIDSRVNVQPSLVALFTPMRVGVEKGRTSYSRGDVAFLPSGGLVCFFLKDSRSEMPLNPIGKVEDGLSALEGVKRGDTVRLEAVAASLQPSQ
ncbi:MAG: hypothetical protein OK438_01750 [Thaumarchaeota archaeon]|nr:hypothetical protein [Nitrososphaerota archaeon]